MSEVSSPCIRQCELNESNICKGCYRSLDEIARWGKAANQDRKLIVRKARQRLINFMETQSNN
ncbi:DUF1289 domain-containing protein [Endozoicomonas sp. OPT23]|uniref:DUF1289 domain-containing protein n=1 Tax=Endozoicomonas sp. OPT23 TaxID=2072845 RepID=UPI00129AC26F|nr:DUF1289 domain-containing protein [Endozoicomonas sp. OPT23]MRI32520.1 DUF1289 domain-containing protein [Endozoicomonas sp. OPT23]